MKLISFFYEEYSKQSTIALIIVCILLFLIEYLVYTKEEKILKKSNKIIKFIFACVVRLSEFIIASFGISICLIGYWMVKKFYLDSYTLNLTILFPFILFLSGYINNKIINYLHKRRHHKKYAKNKLSIKNIINTELPNDEQKERNFLSLFTLVYLMIIGLFSYKFLPAHLSDDLNIGYWIIALILGRFFWFDTTLLSLKNDLENFLPSPSYIIQLILPVSLVSYIVFYTFSLDLNHVIGIFLGFFFNILLLTIIASFLLIRKLIKRLKRREKTVESFE